MTAGHSGHREKKKARKTIQGVGGGLLIPAQFGVGGEGVGGPQRRAQIHGNQRRRKTEEGLAASIKCYHVGSWRRMQAERGPLSQTQATGRSSGLGKSMGMRKHQVQIAL